MLLELDVEGVAPRLEQVGRLWWPNRVPATRTEPAAAVTSDPDQVGVVACRRVLGLHELDAAILGHAWAFTALMSSSV